MSFECGTQTQTQNSTSIFFKFSCMEISQSNKNVTNIIIKDRLKRESEPSSTVNKENEPKVPINENINQKDLSSDKNPKLAASNGKSETKSKSFKQKKS